ncbi:MAG: hypothetical protein WBC91_14750 [Phototrophicaceae bacterium]
MPAHTETIITIDDYVFRIMVNPANVLAQMQRDVFYSVGTSEAVFLRSFFLDDIQHAIILAFCQQFVQDASFRQASLDRTAGWAVSNDLFLRNCFNPYYQSNPCLEQIGSLVRAYTFFIEHTPHITALPQYQQIAQHDNAHVPHPQKPDPQIADIVSAFNQIQGVKTLASCQGVSDTVHYQGYDLMTLSHHARFAYIWFTAISKDIMDSIKSLNNPHIAINDDIYPTLQSTGDNSAFLNDLYSIIIEKE